MGNKSSKICKINPYESFYHKDHRCYIATTFTSGALMFEHYIYNHPIKGFPKQAFNTLKQAYLACIREIDSNG